jgi:small subunit ribosomal protein S6
MSETKNKKEYEMAYFLTSEIAEENAGAETEEIVKILSENGGESVQFNPLQIKRLAYPIKKQNQAYFGVVFFLSDNEGLEKIKKALVFNKKILRFLIVNATETSDKIISDKIAALKIEKPMEQPTAIPETSFEEKLKNILKS